MEEGQEVGSQRNSGQDWPLRCLLVEYILGRCRHRGCRLNTDSQNVVGFLKKGVRQTWRWRCIAVHCIAVLRTVEG